MFCADCCCPAATFTVLFFIEIMNLGSLGSPGPALPAFLLVLPDLGELLLSLFVELTELLDSEAEGEALEFSC